LPARRTGISTEATRAAAERFLAGLTAGQRELAFGLIRASFSAAGAMQAENIMKLSGTLAELVGPEWARVFGRWNYAITMMGTPSASEPWGWQLDGRYLNLRERR
jgi:hypothetical protein